MEFNIKEILKAWNLTEDSPEVQVSDNCIAVVDQKITFVYRNIEDRLTFHAYAPMTKRGNFKLLNDINIATDFGTHVINDGTYEYNYEKRITEIPELIKEMPVFVNYTKRQAYQGYKILNTASDVLRSKLLKAHAENRDL